MNTADQIRRAILDYQEARFGVLRRKLATSSLCCEMSRPVGALCTLHETGQFSALAVGAQTILTWMQRMGARLGAIALLAMLVCAVVPAGYRLAQAETPSGRFLTVDFCEGHDPVKRVLDTETRKLIDPSDVPAGEHDATSR